MAFACFGQRYGSLIELITSPTPSRCTTCYATVVGFIPLFSQIMVKILSTIIPDNCIINRAIHRSLTDLTDEHTHKTTITAVYLHAATFCFTKTNNNINLYNYADIVINQITIY